MINSFTNEYRFLSNFWPATVIYMGKTYPTVEHAYQAAKFDDPYIREQIGVADSPVRAKKLARTFTPQIREAFHMHKIEIMHELLFQKFTKHDQLRHKLLATHPHELVEGNWWNDTFWGVCAGKGQNNLGKLLMNIRSQLNA